MDQAGGSRQPWPWHAPLLAAAVALALLAGDQTAVLDELVADATNRFLPLRGGPKRDRLPLIVGIGERTLAELGKWPLPRRHHAELLRRLHAQGAKVVAFDIVFDRPAPQAADDQALAAALRDTEAGVLAMFLQPVVKMSQEDMRLEQRTELKLPVDVLARGALGTGFVNIAGPGEEIGILRACRLAHEQDGRKWESLAAVAARHTGFSGETGPRKMWIRYVGSSAGGVLRQVEMADVLGNRANLGNLEGVPVLVGATARSLGDLKESPLGELPGVEVNANIVADLLGAGFLEVPRRAVTCVAVLVAALLAALVLRAAPAFARWLGAVYLTGAALVALLLASKGIVTGQAAVLVAVPLACLLPTRRAAAPCVTLEEVRRALDAGETANASALARRMAAGPARDAATAEALLAGGETEVARRLLEGLDREALDEESLYRLALALEGASLLAAARDLYGLLQRRDVGFRDAGRRFLDLDARLVEQTTVLGPEGVLRALEAQFDSVERVAAGASGMLYRCREQRTAREVAVKVLDPRLLTSGEALTRFRREVEVLGSLSHSGIVGFRGATFGKLCYYRMDFVAGESLAARLGRGWRASETEAESLLRQAARALAHAHDAGVLHRDLKPSNLMLDPDGRLVIVDFGVARVEGAERLTREGTFVGTMSWAAPEQLRGESVDWRADIYSLGAVVRELGGPAADNWKLAPLLAAMTADEPAARPASMQEVLSRLDACHG